MICRAEGHGGGIHTCRGGEIEEINAASNLYFSMCRDGV